MRASRSASVGVVAELVDVETTFSVGILAGDVPGDCCGRVLVLLLEGDGALDVGVTAEDSNCDGVWSAPCNVKSTRQQLFLFKVNC